MWIHQQPDWPRLHWNDEALATVLADVRHRQGRLIGRMEALGFDLQREAVLGTLVEDVVKSSDIEGERLDAGQVRSSVARRLGMDLGGVGRADRDVEGVVEMMLDVTRRYDVPLALNDRQRRVLNRLLDGFEGKLTTSKWAKLAQCSQDTALRDIAFLIDHGVLVRNPGGGRSTSYGLVEGR